MPAEYFNHRAMRGAGSPDYPQDPNQQLAEVQRRAATPNGIYGLKVLTGHFDWSVASEWPQRLPALSFVYMDRRDLLGQAISHERAVQTSQWSSLEGAAKDPAYDTGLISKRLAACAQDEARWRYYFARNGISPLHLTYEDFADHPQTAVAAIAELMGLPEAPVAHLERSRFTIQRDALSDEWRERFLAESRAVVGF